MVENEEQVCRWAGRLRRLEMENRRAGGCGVGKKVPGDRDTAGTGLGHHREAGKPGRDRTGGRSGRSGLRMNPHPTADDPRPPRSAAKERAHEQNP